MLRPAALVITLLTVAVPATAAEIQSSGHQTFPGSLQAAFHPFGFQLGWTGNEATGYKMSGDFAGRIVDSDKLSVWLGGGLGYVAWLWGCSLRAYCGYHDFQFWGFVEFSFEKLVNFPIVPFVRAGVGGDILLYGSVGGALFGRLGVGAHYFIIKNIGLGLEANFSSGVGFYGNNFGYSGIGVGFHGAWDTVLGARFAF